MVKKDDFKSGKDNFKQVKSGETKVEESYRDVFFFAAILVLVETLSDEICGRLKFPEPLKWGIKTIISGIIMCYFGLSFSEIALIKMIGLALTFFNKLSSYGSNSYSRYLANAIETHISHAMLYGNDLDKTVVSLVGTSVGLFGTKGLVTGAGQLKKLMPG